jgi:hypothetical protein
MFQGVVGSPSAYAEIKNTSSFVLMPLVYLHGMPLKLSDRFSGNDLDISSGCVRFESKLGPQLS